MKRQLLSSIAAGLITVGPLTTAYGQSVLPSELLEKGIYAQETRGDLDAAIALYQQLVGDAKANQQLAAEAQFRLGQCLLKKNRVAEATAAFERLIKDFPDETELIAKAREHVPGALVLGPVPWVDGEELQLGLKLANGLDIGTMLYRARSAQVDGRKVWQLGSRMFAKANGFSWVEASWEDFRPLRSRWMHPMLGDVTAAYGRESVLLKRVGEKEDKTVPLMSPVYDNEQAVHLMRRLPLAIGYKATLPICSTLSNALISLPFEVKTVETVVTKAGKWECFKVELGMVNQTFWFTTDARRLVTKFAGGGVTAELVAMNVRPAGQPVRWQNDELGVTVVAPADWVIHLQDPDQEPDHNSIYLLDPEAQAETCLLRLHAMSALSDAEKVSSRAWAESQAGKLPKFLKDAQIRADSWKELKIGGRTAVSFIADYRDNEKPMVLRGIHALGSGTNAEQFTLTASPANFDALQPAFESILGSYKVE